MEREDCVHVVELIRGCYGNSYGVDYFYNPDALIDEMESGRLHSVIAIRSQQIVGHMALSQHHMGSAVCEAGKTVVQRSMRGQGLMTRLAVLLHELALEVGFTGYIQYPTTSHHIMQNASVAHGGIETGLMLGSGSAESDFRQRAPQARRIATTIVYQPLRKAALRKLQRLPQRYAAILGELYRRLELPRQIDSEPSKPLRSKTQLEARFNLRHQCLHFELGRMGENLVEEVEALINLRQPCVSYIDLPVDCNGVDLAVETLNSLGFFFSGLLPDFGSVDILRMQNLSSASELDFQPDLANTSGRELLEIVKHDARSAVLLVKTK